MASIPSETTRQDAPVPQLTAQATPASEEADDDDGISITSSADLGYGPDHLYEVEALRAEKTLRDGSKKYLVEWSNFAFHDCTWEPEEGINEILKDSWERTKAEIAAGLRPPYQEEIARFKRAKEAETLRRQAKNAKRIRAGLDPIYYPDFRESDDEGPEPPVGPSRSADSSGDEAHASSPATEHRTDHQAQATRPLKPTPAPRAQQQRSVREAPENSGSPNPATRRPSNASSKDSSTSSKKTGNVSVVQSATGYQGTARPPGSRAAAPISSTSLSSAREKVSAKTGTGQKARRSAKPAIVNVFLDGKKRKPRRTASTDYPPDPSLEPRPSSSGGGNRFFNLSTRRRIELRARDLENAAPNIMTLKDMVFPPNQDPVRASPLTEVAVPGGNSSSAPEKRGAGASAAGDLQPLKKRKSVRFVGSESPEAAAGLVVEPDHYVGDVDDTTPMDLDRPEPEGKAADQSASRKLTLSEYQASRFATQDVVKKATFGPASGTQLDICFTGMRNDKAWFSPFLSEDLVHFSHTCLADCFLARLQAMRLPGDHSWQGDIRSAGAPAEEALANVAERLRAAGSGILFSRPSYNILAYPAKSHEWNFPDSDAPAGPPEVVLRYYLFVAALDMHAFLNWDPEELPQDRSDRELAMEKVFGLGRSLYNRLVPPPPKQNKNPRHLFYLVFPPSLGAGPVFQLMLWLRACNPRVEVFLSQQPGSWNAFLSKAKSWDDSAVLIIHGSAMSIVRRIPGLLGFLGDTRAHLVWYWPDKSRSSPSLLPSYAEPGVSSGMFDIRPIRLFPHNHVFLLTPSFYVAEPAHALELVIELTHRNKATRGARKLLMVPADIVDFLKHIADSHRDSRPRHDLALAMLDTIGPRLQVVPDQSFASPVLLVDDEIDAYDEQSLVNWFGAWSISHADQYRKFHVVGTGRRSPRTECVARIPHYRQDTINDPDALRKAQEGEARRVVQPAPPPPPPAVIAPTPAKPRFPRTKFESELLSSDDFDSLRYHLMGLQSRGGKAQVAWRLYGFPIHWKDSDEAYRHSNTDHRLKSICHWFDYTYAFDSKYRVYVGFFYTVPDDWDPDAAPRGQRPPRLPWVAIYRCKRQEQTDLVIVDPTTKERLGNIEQPSLSDLTTAQQALVKYVAEKAPLKKPRDWVARQYLGAVWVGDIPADVPGSPVDRCLRFIDRFLVDWDNVPLADGKLVSRGFKVVNVDGSATQPRKPQDIEESASVQKGAGPGTPEHDEWNCKIVFHAPAAWKPFQGASRCRNHFFEAARLARLRDPGAKTMTYTYRPTMDWYAEQEAEGRDFSHINVGEWETTFAEMIHPSRKPTDAKAPSTGRVDGSRQQPQGMASS